jgi:hypothetical protein
MRDGVWLAFALVVSALMQAPFTNFTSFASALSSGDGRVQAWVLAWVAHAIASGQPLFDANMFYPAPRALAHTDHMVALGTLALPFWLATHNAVLVFNVFKILGPALAIWAAARLTFAWTRDPAAAFIAGVAFGSGSFTLLHNAHLNLTWSAGIPLAVLGLERWWREPTWLRLLAWWIPLVVTALVSWYLAILAGVAIALWIVMLSTQTTRGDTSRTSRHAIAAQLAASALLAVAVLLPVAAPYLGRGSERGEAYAANWQSYLVPHEHTVAGRWLAANDLANPQGIWGEHSLFLGWTIVSLAIVGASFGLRDREQKHRVVFLMALAIAAAAFSFGPSASGLAPYDWLQRVPGLSGFRATARFGLLVALGCAVLAGYGLASLRTRMPRARALLAATCLGAVIAESYIVDFPSGLPRSERIPEIYAQAAADHARAAVALPMYAGESIWFFEGDYLLYSTTAGFLPLANGIGRWVPDTYLALGQVTRTFPSAECAQALRFYGISHVLFHGARYADGGEELLARARSSDNFSIVSRVGADALLRVNER